MNEMGHAVPSAVHAAEFSSAREVASRVELWQPACSCRSRPTRQIQLIKPSAQVA